MSYLYLEDMPPAVAEHTAHRIMSKVEPVLEAARAKGLPTRPIHELRLLLDDHWRWVHDLEVVLLHGYALLFTVVPQWWLQGDFLVEQFLVRLEDDADFTAAITAIETLARDRGCTHVAVGTAAAPDAAYSRLLTRRGFRVVAHQLIKEV